MAKKARRRVPRAKAVQETPDKQQDEMWLWLLRDLLDHHDPYDLLNDRNLRAGMRELTKRMMRDGGGALTRPDVATQAFVFAAALERERYRSLVSMSGWPCHDDLSECCVEESELIVEVGDGTASPSEG